MLLSCIAKQGGIVFFFFVIYLCSFLSAVNPKGQTKQTNKIKKRSTFELDGAMWSLKSFQCPPAKRLEAVPLSCVLEVACERAQFLWENNKNPSEDLLKFGMLADEILTPHFFSFFLLVVT